ncbi:MAG: hypothetical protein ABH879_02865 [archaeon]
MWKPIVLFFFLLPFAFGQGVPQLPTVYWGHITKDGAQVNGLYVKIYTEDGMLLGTDPEGSRSDGAGGEGAYFVNVAWDDPLTEEREGIRYGEWIIFKINDEVVKELVIGEQGSDYNIDIDLSRSSVSPPDRQGTGIIPPPATPAASTQPPGNQLNAPQATSADPVPQQVSNPPEQDPAPETPESQETAPQTAGSPISRLPVIISLVVAVAILVILIIFFSFRKPA